MLERSIRRGPTPNKYQRAKDQLSLDKQGFPAEAVNTWADLLLCNDPEQAAEGLLSLPGQCPAFVFLLIFKRQDHTPKSLRYLLSFSSLRLNGSSGEGLRIQPLSLQTVGLMTARLAYHARRILPSLLPEIAQLLHGRYVSDEKTQLDGHHRLQLNNFFNSLLLLFCRRSTTKPLANAVYNARAQTIILRKMAKFKPNLTISRTGFRALVASHQSLPKTEREHLWAELKSTDWPPWKVDRTSADSELGFHDGISLSHKLIRQMEVTGFPTREWDLAARVLSGWDTDMTPTYQFRHLHDVREISSVAVPTPVLDSTNNVADPDPHSELVWAARVKSTRTAQESWTIFSNYLHQRKGVTEKASQIYLELISKIDQEKILVAKARRSERIHSSADFQNVPGDTPKVFARPSTLREASDFPSRSRIVALMARDGIKSDSSQFVNAAIKNAVHPATGMKHFRNALGDALNFNLELLDSNFTKATLRDIPDNLLSALVTLFCRFKILLQATDRNQGRWHFLSRQHLAGNPTTCAAELLLVWRPQIPGPWHTVLKSLCIEDLKLVHAKEEKPAMLRIRNHLSCFDYVWRIFHAMVQEKRIFDTTHFEYVCMCFTKTMQAAHLHSLFQYEEAKIRLRHPWVDTSALDTPVQAFLQKGLSTILAAFQELTGQDFHGLPKREDQRVLTDQSGTPILIQVPSLESLHALVQALGMAGEFRSLLNLLKWIRRNEDAIYTAARLERPAHAVGELKRAIRIAARYFILVPRNQDGLLRPRVPGLWTPPDEELCGEIRDVVMGLDGGCEWPGYAEAEEYCRKQPAARRHRLWLIKVEWTFPGSAIEGDGLPSG
ncbi:MAG: hypothetical protein M1814_004120 [Vezdaea aestivalis]|nr:MAG: hypothetical protein M1814_004120 [Vezdaea aestivalis]